MFQQGLCVSGGIGGTGRRLTRGDAAAARTGLEAALASFRRLGARSDVESAERFLDRLG